MQNKFHKFDLSNSKQMLFVFLYQHKPINPKTFNVYEKHSFSLGSLNGTHNINKNLFLVAKFIVLEFN